MNTFYPLIAKTFKKVGLAVGLVALSVPAFAASHHGGSSYHGRSHYNGSYHGGSHYNGSYGGGYHHGYLNNNWVGAAVATGLIGGLIYDSVNRPYYTEPNYTYYTTDPYGTVYYPPTYVSPRIVHSSTWVWDPYLGRYVRAER